MSAVGGSIPIFGSVLGAAGVILPVVGSSIEYAVTDKRSETAAWASAAGMKDFQTYRQSCKDELESPIRLARLEGVTSVDLGFDKPIHKPNRGSMFRSTYSMPYQSA